MAYQRIVCFKFKDGTPESAIQHHMDSFKALRQQIPQIVSYRGGLASAGDHNQPPDFDSLHYLTFASEEDIDIYYHHPAHQQFIKDNAAIWAGGFVINSPFDD